MDKVYQSKVKRIVEKAKKEGKIKDYSEFCETNDAKLYQLAEDEVQYYTSKNQKEI